MENENKPAALLAQIQDLRRQGRHAEILQLAQAYEAAELDAMPQILHRLGRASQELGQLEAASQWYQKAIAARKGAAAAKSWHQLGRVREAAGDTEGAAEAYRQAIAGFEAKQAWAELGISAFQLGRIEQARKQMSAAGEAYKLARKHLASQAELRAEACYALAEIALQEQDLDQADSLLGEALSIHRHLGRQGGIGICLLKQCQLMMLRRDWKAVMSTVKEAITALELSRETGALILACELQGELLELINQPDQAKVWFEKAQQLKNTSV